MGSGRNDWPIDGFPNGLTYGTPKGGSGSGVFVGVCESVGLGINRVATSEEGLHWTRRTAAKSTHARTKEGALLPPLRLLLLRGPQQELEERSKPVSSRRGSEAAISKA